MEKTTESVNNSYIIKGIKYRMRQNTVKCVILRNNCKTLLL